jgi:hypothetical protein
MILLSLQSEIVDLNLEVESVKANAVVSGSSAQQHIFPSILSILLILSPEII